MSSTESLPSPSSASNAQTALPRAPKAWGRSLQFFAEAFLELFGLIWLVFAFSLVPIGVGIWMLPGALEFARSNADRSRVLARGLTGVRVEATRRIPSGPEGPGHLFHTRQRLADPVVQRDLVWQFTNPLVGMVLGIVSFGLVLEGAWELAAMPFQIAFDPFRPATWFTIAESFRLALPAVIAGAVVMIAIQIAVGVVLARPLLLAQGAWAHLVLHRDDPDLLRERAATLVASRADALDLEQAELQRIERDLHDGAQMRFISTGLTISEASRLVHEDPDRAVALLGIAKDESAAGLAELRDLVRGIRPPVLADRGLVDAIRALARDAAIPVTVTATLTTRLAAPLESALYFATAEALTNAAKHSGATSVHIDLGMSADTVSLVVTDNGKGGAGPIRDHGGLAGVRRRLSTFDGRVAIESPEGGPTSITVTAPIVTHEPHQGRGTH